MNNKNQWLLAVIILVFFTIALVFMLKHREIELRQQRSREQGEEQILLSSLDFKELELVNLEIGETNDNQGYLVIVLLKTIDVGWDDLTSVSFSSRDGGRIIVSKEEITDKQVALVPYKGRREVEFRLVFPQDPFRNRWLKDIVSIEIH